VGALWRYAPLPNNPSANQEKNPPRRTSDQIPAHEGDATGAAAKKQPLGIFPQGCLLIRFQTVMAKFFEKYTIIFSGG
jgi:hypothetical protein